MSRFIMIPLWVKDAGLTPAEMVFYIELAAFRINRATWRHCGFGFPTRDELEQATGLKKRRVNELLQALQDKGVIGAVREDNRLSIDYRDPEVRAEEAPTRAEEAPTRAEEAPATPTSIQEDLKKTTRGPPTPAHLPTIDEFLAGPSGAVLDAKFPACDGVNGRLTIREHCRAGWNWQAGAPKSKRWADPEAGMINWIGRDYDRILRARRSDAKAGEHYLTDPHAPQRTEAMRRQKAEFEREVPEEERMSPDEVRALLSGVTGQVTS